jgi:hypothetical protein
MTDTTRASANHEECGPVPDVFYQCHSVIDRWGHHGVRYDGVKVKWYAPNRVHPWSDEALLQEWPEEDVDHLLYLMFSPGEVEVLRAYLLSEHHTEVIATPYRKGDVLEPGCHHWHIEPLDSYHAVYMLYEETSYRLAFNVEGYYGVLGREEGVDQDEPGPPWPARSLPGKDEGATTAALR